jgi:hypothetical protein
MGFTSYSQFDDSIATLFDEVKRGLIETLPCADADRRRKILLMLSMMQEVRESMNSKSVKESQK